MKPTVEHHKKIIMFLLLSEKHNKKQFVLPRLGHHLKELAGHPGRLAFASQSKIPVEDEEAPGPFSRSECCHCFTSCCMITMKHLSPLAPLSHMEEESSFSVKLPVYPEDSAHLVKQGDK